MDPSPQHAPKAESFKRTMSLQVQNKTDDETVSEAEPVVDVAPTPTVQEVEATFGKALEELAHDQ